MAGRGRWAVCLAVCLAAVSSPGAKAQWEGYRAIGCDSQGRVHVAQITMEATVVYRCFESGAWSEWSLVSTGYYPMCAQLAVGADDTVHVVWTDACATPDNAEVWYSSLGAEGWAAPVAVSEQDGWDWNPSLAAAPNGDLHLAWQHARGTYTDQPRGQRMESGTGVSWLVHRVKTASGWGEPVTVDDSGGSAGEIAADPGGTVHMLYNVEQGMPGATATLASYSDGQWTVEGTVNASVAGERRGLLAYDGSGGAHVVFWPRRGMQPLVVTSGPGGASAPEAVGPGVWEARAGIALQAGPDGTVYLAYPARVGNAPANYQCRAFGDGQWSDPVGLLADVPLAPVSMAIAPDGTIHLIWGTMGEFLHAYGKGDQWQWGAQE